MALLLISMVTPNHTHASSSDSNTFRAFSVDTNISNLFYDVDGEQIPFSANKWRFSKQFPAPKNGTLTLYREEPPIPPATLPTQVIVSEIALADSVSSLIFLREPSPNTKHSSLTGIAYDNSLENNPAGHIQILNFCDSHIIAELDNKKLELPINRTQIVKIDSNDPKLWLKAATYVDGEWELRISGPERIRQNAQSTWVFLTLHAHEHDPQPDQLALRKLHLPLPRANQ